ncbi:MAG: methyltransferase domain-containing protein [Bacteroidetes bacterium]|nr:MAG: methyltransferase domain-containing protein [Bacteroidota bacterium]
MRIIRGKLKSRRFSPPKKFPSRPTTDFAKEGLFNMLENQWDLASGQLEILDLCAGTGNISLEFASREAGHIEAVDSNYHCVKFIQQMIRENGLEEVIQVYKADIRDFVRRSTKSYDLIFADPPYAASFYEELRDNILEGNLLKPEGMCIIEHGKQSDLSQHPKYQQTRKFGNVHFSFFAH